MKRRVLAITLAMAMAAGLAGCGGGSSTTGGSAADSTAATTAAAGSEGAEGAESAEAAGESALPDWKPSGAVSLVVPAGAGGDTDLTARIFAQYAKEKTGIDFVVVNANGAAGSVAANQVMSAAPNGETALFGHCLLSVANIAGITDYNFTAFKLGPNFAKNPAQQFYVNADKYKSLDEFIEAAKANPGQLKACTEVGAYTYYELLAFEKAAGIDLDLVDAGSASDKIAAMLSGQVDLMPGTYMLNKDYLESGQFICLGAPTIEKYDALGDIKTFTEQGIDLAFPDTDYSLYFPAETPDEVIAFFDALAKELLEDPEVQEALTSLDVIPYYLNSEDAYANDQTTYDTIKAVADQLAE
ncbi:MAG: tripartite tricarboxylate transporter substrate binding protein [Clostridium sp.]|nr:tripartite tricarboxylate transporter substrate binding protein [Clostridium sp.]